MAEYAWLSVDSSMIHSLCGEYSTFTLASALDGTGSATWEHLVSHTHWFILDLGGTYNITKMRGRSNASYDPIDVDIFLSDDVGGWGDAVAEEITTFQDSAAWQNVDTTDKVGRYIKVIIYDTEAGGSSNIIYWGFQGSPLQPIFDVYGIEVTNVELSGDSDATSGTESNLISVPIHQAEPFPPERNEDYDPNAYYDEGVGDYITLSIGGGRYRTNLVAVGRDSNGCGVIYFGGED